MSVQFAIAGTGPVGNSKRNKKIYNHDLSHIVKGHLDYSRKLSQVLAAVGVSVKQLSPSELSGECFREAVGEAQDALSIATSDFSISEKIETPRSDVDATSDRIEEILIKDK